MLIGTPDHWHVPMTIDACAAGKDVYVEKPLTHDLSEGAAVIEAQNKHQRIVQVGTQQRSMPQFQKAYEIVKSGQLGDDSQGAPHLEPQHAPRPEAQPGHRSQDASTGSSFSARPGNSRSTSTASAIGAGSGISAAASSPT